ncbi:YkvA family protein [Phenylobacterium sp.]|jgi:uncharacterized membrane protein YkvA (DUF1232 family)|uniref:YkvA family protein n=1 Tax=Phenylobacterium sp. TaxID=1871053 RepID=UPI002F9261BD
MSASDKASPDVKAEFDPRTPIDPSRALVPSVVQLNEQRVAVGFWPKIRKVVAHVPFAAEALSVWYCARDEETPTAAKGMMLAALAYFVVPTDVIPDFIAGLGYTDDAAVFTALLGVVGRHLKPRHRQAARTDIKKLRDDR